MHDDPSVLPPQEDATRYHDYVQRGDGLWHLRPDELEIARYLFHVSPSLRRVRLALDVPQARLRIPVLRRWAASRPERALLLCTALPLITIPQLARAHYCDPQWTAIVALLDSAELHVLAGAHGLKSTTRHDRPG